MKDIVLSQQDIEKIVKRLAKVFTEKYKDAKLPPVFVGVMKGAIPFMTDLIQEIGCPVLTDYVQVKSYSGTETTGVITLKKDISMDVHGRDVIIVEDIIDSGYTLKWLTEYIRNTHSPDHVYTCALLDKHCRRKTEFEGDYIGMEIEDHFIVGYGLDYNEYFRNEKEIFIPTREQIALVDSLTKKN